MEVSGKTIQITSDPKDLCELCHIGDTQIANADGVCLECDQFMCNTCFQYHLKVKSCKNHVLVNIAKFSLQKESEIAIKCKTHCGELIKFYCRKHEIVGCGECMIPDHIPCQPENIKDLSKDFQENDSFKSLLGKLDDIRSAIIDNKKRVEEGLKSNITMQEEAKEEIKKFRTRINDYLDKAESNILQELENTHCKNKEILEKLERELLELFARATELGKKIDTETYRESSLFVQAIESKPGIIEIEQEMSRIKMENNIKQYTFIPDQQLKTILLAPEKLGNLDGLLSESISPTKSPGDKEERTSDNENGDESHDESESIDGLTQDDNDSDNSDEDEDLNRCQISEGSIVRPIGKPWSRGYFKVHRGQNGTVIKVNDDNSFAVRWHATGRKSFRLTMYSVELV
ncbi:E3 ubiquitin-protein ligase TRIM45-like [Ruditapes philippinarum]|uniref:E3 ubiquitin-protein ligase TRIM45-like n=1 Tax=Ruditapes philippinarum TaxID=129788 RepID=UPI00295B5094|nr:E3 ubiquitin-protein ligase TRIM45-like [Ruditapes philippinarum]